MSLVASSHQHTLRRPVRCTGTGLHSGKTVHVDIKPAPAHSGIVFVRSDLPQRPRMIATHALVSDTTLATTIGQGPQRIATIEHLMAALHGLGVDNALIEVDAPEVPIMDGSAWPFVQLLHQAGKHRQAALRPFLRIKRPLRCGEGDKHIRLEPHPGFKVSGSIDFDDSFIHRQHYSSSITPKIFIRDIAQARTFGYVEQVEELWRRGLALGGTLENVIAIHWNRKSILNEGGLRFADEFIRHKVLDIIGDMALVGMPILGHIIASRSGHSLHLELIRNLFAHPECWDIVASPQAKHPPLGLQQIA